MRKYAVTFLFSIMVLLLVHCGEQTTKQTTDLLTNSNGDKISLPDNFLTQMRSPYDVDKHADSLAQALFAWSEMIALARQSSYTQDSKRDKPDANWSYADGTPNEPTVWETYAHRIEYRPEGDSLTKPFDSKPSYEFELEEGSRIDWNGIDPSKHFVVLDEDNEINSCFLFAGPSNAKEKKVNNLVMYMAKVNRVEYDYRQKNFTSGLDIKEGIAAVAVKDKNGKVIKKAKRGPSGKLRDSIDIDIIKGISLNDPCGTKGMYPGAIIFPCGDADTKEEGVIEIKTAWRPYIEGQDDPSKYLMREAVVFDEIDAAVIGGSQKIFKANLAKYLLIGMHIIHKTKNFPTFFIATWEHNDVEQHGFDFILNKDNTTIQKAKRHNPKDGAGSLNDFTYNTVSNAVQAKIRATASDPNNVHYLANYRLTGYQSNVHPDLPLAQRKRKMPSYYLANYVIESDSSLANFSGSGVQNSFDDKPNIVSEGKFITTGGCSGCHGVAQVQSGTDFSFLTDFVFKPIPEPDVRVLPAYKLNKLLGTNLKTED